MSVRRNDVIEMLHDLGFTNEYNAGPAMLNIVVCDNIELLPYFDPTTKEIAHWGMRYLRVDNDGFRMSANNFPFTFKNLFDMQDWFINEYSKYGKERIL